MTRANLLLWPLLLSLLAGCSEEKLCSPDHRLCDGECKAISVDPSHCGACGVACGAGESCYAGACFCPFATTCDGACVDLESDAAHCGACDAPCEPGLVCTKPDGGAPSCESSCLGTGQVACGRACVDLQSHRQNCGACGRSCGSNERCDAGRCVAELYLACFNSDEVRGATGALAAAGIPLQVAPGPVGLAWVGSELLVASARPGGAETLSAVRFDLPGVRIAEVLETALPNPDIQYLAAHGGLLYLSHASAGTLLVVTPSGAVVDEVALAPMGDPNPNPQGLAFSGDELYVALNARNEVAVIDISGVADCASGARPPPCTSEVARVNLQPLANVGANAMPSRIAIAGDRAFVTLWNLDDWWTPPQGSTGRLAAISLATHELDSSVSEGGDGLVDLRDGCLNAADVALHGETLWVSCGAFDYSAYPAVTIRGAGLVPVNLSGTLADVGPVVGMAADQAPGKLAFCGTAGYVADRNSGRVFPLDAATSSVGAGVELCPASNGFAYVSDLACGP
jgi:hypothetical protein